jgi:branched-chain amino acid transport system substrate-binding protein
MPMRRRGFLTALMTAVVFCGLWLTACNKQSGGNGGSGDINIGEFASLTGDTATFGISSDEGIQLAKEEINAKGGVLGRKINVLVEDDRSIADEARTAAEKLISRDKVVALLGEISSSKSIAAAPAAQNAHVPMLSPGSTNPKVTKMGDYVFRACFIDPFQGEAMARFAMDELKLKKFAFLYAVNSDYSTGLRDYVKQTLLKKGGQVLAEQSYTESKDKDFKAQLTSIKNAEPDAIFVTGYYTEAGVIAKQARELGITCPLIGGDGWDSDQTIKIGKQAVEGCYFANHYSPDEQRPEVQAFVAAYKAKYKGKVPDAMAILGYDAMKLLADAIQRAGSTDSTKIRDALASTKNFPGAAGAITIDAERNANKPIVIVKIDQGQFKYVTTIKPQ